jgi:uncharacterized membrane protein (UPF0127 family)
MAGVAIAAPVFVVSPRELSMERRVNIKQRATGQVLISDARWGDSYFSRLRGLMFRQQLNASEALVIVEAHDSRATASIHMFFVPFSIAVVWINDAGRVVDKVLAEPWRPFYAPREPARYTLETHPDFLDKVTVGDEIVFETL